DAYQESIIGREEQVAVPVCGGLVVRIASCSSKDRDNRSRRGAKLFCQVSTTENDIGRERVIGQTVGRNPSEQPGQRRRMGAVFETPRTDFAVGAVVEGSPVVLRRVLRIKNNAADISAAAGSTRNGVGGPRGR